MRLMSSRAAAGAALLAAVLAAAPAITPASAAAAAPAQSRPGHAGVPSGKAVAGCPAPAPGYAACAQTTAAAGAPGTARVRIRGGTRAATASSTPAGLGPSDLQATYKLQGPTSGMRQIVAVIGAGADPSAAGDLTAYRSQWGLPPCTTSDGCLTIENQTGNTDPASLPGNTLSGWPSSDQLALEVISATCPNCKLILVEASTASIGDLATAANTAGTTTGVHFVDNPFAGPEVSTETNYDTDYNHPGVVMVASAGSGTSYSGIIDYPAASPYVVSAGGTVLTQDSSGTWADTSAWPQTVSGCSLYETAKPAWQHDTGCAGRTDNDVAAAAATSTGGSNPVINSLFIAYYNTSDGGTGWSESGGTGASADLITGIYAMAGTPAANNPAAYPYQNGTYDLTDITTGSTGTCSITYLCNAGTGYDAPTGMGAPNGVESLTATGHTTGLIYGDQLLACLDNYHSTLAAGNKIDIWSCNGGVDSQTWNINSDGTIRISGNTGWCIGVHDGSTADGASVALRACSGTGDEQWRSLANGQLLNQKSGKCMEFPSSGNNGDQVVIEPCGSDGGLPELQQWVMPYVVPSATGEIHYQDGTNLCLDNSHSSLTANNPIQVWTCDGGTNSQEWTVSANDELTIGSGAWCIQFGPVLSVSPLNITAELQRCSPDVSNLWFAQADGELVNYDDPLIDTEAFPGPAICMSASGTSSGSPVQLNSCGAGKSDQWTLP